MRLPGGEFIDRRDCSTLARVCGAGSTCARIAQTASAHAISEPISITKVCAVTSKPYSDGNLAPTRPMPTGARIAAAISTTSVARENFARPLETTGLSSTNRPNAKYSRPIHGRVVGLPNSAHDTMKLASVAPIAHRLNP